MKKFLLSTCFLVLIISKVDAQCGTCSNADCSVVGPKTGATASADLTTEMQKTAVIFAKAFYVAGDPIDSKFGPYTFTNCYVVSVTSSSQTLGLKLSSVITGTNPTYTGVLYKGNNSCSNPINPTRTDVAGGSSGFNPEWDGLVPGVYTYCLTVNIPAGSSINSILMGYYLSGTTVTPSNTCSDCATAACDIAGPYPDFATADLGEKFGDATNNQCSKKVDLSSSPVQSPNKYISYYKVKTSSTATTLGIIISNKTGTTDGSGNSCPKPTREATLYSVGSNCASGTLGSSTSNTTNFFNVEWSGLTSNTDYIIKVETLATSGCQVEDQCASYYSPGSVTPPPVPPCPTDKSYITLDWNQSNPFIAWAGGQTFTCSSPVQTIHKNVEISTITTGGQLQPFPGFKMSLTTNSNSPNKTSALVSVNGEPYSYYGPTGTAPSGLLDWGPMASGGQDIMEPYLPKGATVSVKVCDTRTANQTFKDTIFDYATGAVLDKGSFSVNSGACKTFTFTLSNPTVSWTLDGGTTGITNNNNGSVTFDPSKLSSGTHTLQYTFDNGFGCKLIADPVTFTVTGGPIVTGPTTLCEGTTVEWTSTVPLISSDNTFASIAPSGTTTYNITASKPTTSTTNLKLTANSGSCSVIKDLTINPKPTITGNLTLCADATSQLNGYGTAATTTPWVSATTTNATISNAGLVTAASAGNGTSEITYTDNNGCIAKSTVTVNPKLATTIKCGTPTSSSVKVEWTSVTPATGYSIEVNKGSGYGTAIPVGISPLSYDVTGLSASDVVKFKISPTGPTGSCYVISNEVSCSPANCPKPTLDNNFPVDATVCADLNATASFKVIATSTPEPTYKWQKIVGTNPAVDLQNDAVFDGVDKNILNIKNITGLDGVKFQCVATETSGTGCNITSFAKTLKINPLPTFNPTTLDICEGEPPVITYPSLTGSPDKIIFDAGIPLVPPLNLTLSASPFKITGLPVPLPVNTYSGFKVKLENSTTGCKSTDITIPAFKVQATLKPSISAKSTSVNSVTFQWSDLIGLNTQTGTTKDSYTVKEFVCSGCTTPGAYVNGTGALSYNSTTSKWEYLKNGLTSGDKVFIEVTPVDIAPLATPSCYAASTFDLVAITCNSPIITKDILDVSLCEGTTATPVSSTLSLEYNSADATTPATWEILTPGGSWTTLNPSGIYTITGSTNVDSKLSISDIKGLDGTKYRVNLKTATVSGSCNTISHEAILTVKPLPVMTSITDKLFCPGTIVNDPLKTTKDIEFKVSQYGTPTFTWVSDIQTTGVSTGSPNVNDFASFTTLSPTNDVVSKITVTPTLNQCVGQPLSFNITVKPTVKPIFSTPVTDFSSVKFVWTSSSIAPDFWEIDTAVANVSVPQPPLNMYKTVTPILGTINNYTVSGINSTKKAYINVKAKKSVAANDLFCPVADGYSAIPTPCVKPTKPLTPIVNPVCEGSSITVTGVLPDALANFQWKISTDGGTVWNDVSTTDFGSTGTTNELTTTTTKTYMNNAQVKLVLTDKLTGQCTEESDKVTLVINKLPTVKLIQPAKTSLCVDETEVSATVQPLLGLAPMKVDYTFDGVNFIDKDISTLDIKFGTSTETNHSLSIDKVVDANGCVNLLTGLVAAVSVHKNPTPEFTVSDTIGCLPLLVNFIDISGETYKDVTWDFGTGTNSSKDMGTTTFTYQKEGDYTVTYSVENMNGCKSENVKVNLIHVKSPPKAMISSDRSLINIYENVVRFDSKLSQNATFYKWDFGDNSSISNEPLVNHKYDPNTPGKFKVYLIVSNSPTNMICSDTAITWIDFPEEVIYYIPNTFTPNGDEFNNTFQPIFSSGYDPQNYSFIIFDRWGQIIFESNNPTVGWDGTFGDKVLGNDTFVWKLGFKEKANDNEHYTTGHVNLVK